MYVCYIRPNLFSVEIVLTIILTQQGQTTVWAKLLLDTVSLYGKLAYRSHVKMKEELLHYTLAISKPWLQRCNRRAEETARLYAPSKFVHMLGDQLSSTFELKDLICRYLLRSPQAASELFSYTFFVSHYTVACKIGFPLNTLRKIQPRSREQGFSIGTLLNSG